jgi:hypothetical protein
MRRMKWEWHVACMGENRFAYKILVGKLKEVNHYVDLSYMG